MRELQSILNKYDDFVVHYIDDIMIFSGSDDDHLKHLKIVLENFNEVGLKKLRKPEFLQNHLIFVGYKIDTKGITMNVGRIEAVSQYKRPQINSLKRYV